MEKPLSILFVTSEVIPFVKVGGIADVSYSLPLAIRDMGHDIRVMIPKYGNISERKNRIHEISRLREIPITVGKSTEFATVKSSSMNNPRAKVQAYITTNYKYFNSKKGIYENCNTNEPYSDNDERFIFFSRSVIETCLILGWFPDIIHCNDWQTALIPAYARTMFKKEFKKTKFVFTIHNFHEQGAFPLSTFAKAGFADEIKDNFIHKKKMNFIKAALTYADYITTVSPNYAKELKTDVKYSNGFNEVLKKSKKFKGILNGIDPWGWNPKTDKLIESNYSSDFWDFKNDNKSSLIESFGLEYKEDTPLIAMISRIDDQKGISLIIDAAEEIFKEDVQFILLGEGYPKYKQKLSALAKKYKNKFSIKFGFDEVLAHKIEAGTDLFLLPSKHEPCGLNAIYSLAYGAIPVVRDTGGLSDIITDIDNKKSKGNGITFNEFTKNDFLKALKRGIELYKNKNLWEEIAVNNMAQDYSWKNSVQDYDVIYNKIVK